MPKMHMVSAINLALQQEMKKDKNVLIMGEDVGVNGGVFRVTDGLLKKFGKNRVFDTPLSESGIIGSAIGLAAYGFKPVAEFQFSGFSFPGFDQIVSHASRMRYRSRGMFTCPLVVRMPCSGGVKALEHHQESMESVFIHTPGLKVVMPSTPYDAKGLLISAIRDPDPVIFYEPKRLYRSIKQDVPNKEYEIPIGKANILRKGEDITIITHGTMVPHSMKAAKVMEEEGIEAEVIDLRTLSPLDFKAILNSVKKTGKAVIVHEAPRTLGLGAEISALINEKAILYLDSPVLRVTGFDTVNPLSKLEKYYLPNADKIIQAIKKEMEF